MAMKKTKNGKRHAWNKGKEVGQRNPFSPSDVIRIRKLLAKRGTAGLRDLTLFSTAIDTAKPSLGGGSPGGGVGGTPGIGSGGGCGGGLGI